jgi:hypothetical protein
MRIANLGSRSGGRNSELGARNSEFRKPASESLNAGPVLPRLGPVGCEESDDQNEKGESQEGADASGDDSCEGVASAF